MNVCFSFSIGNLSIIHFDEVMEIYLLYILMQ